MAVHTSAGFMIIGAGMFMVAWRERRDEGAPAWLAITVAVSAWTASIVLWQAEAQSQIPFLELASGLLVGLLLGATTHFARSTQIRANEIRRVNRGLKRDVSARKQAEQALARQAEELRRSNAELEQFAYVASHDLQEPLRMVTSYTQLLAQRYEGKLDSDADEFIAYAVGGAKRMQGLIQDLLAYSRVARPGREFEPADCETVLQYALADMEVLIAESGAVVTHDSLPTLTVEQVQLGQVFKNLIENAVKFRSEDPPRVHVSAEQQSDEWVFSVRDNGIGIDPEYAERIFVIFQRLHGKEEYPGTGMGLTICKKIVEGHGGRIWVESEAGRGATFHFRLPAVAGTRLAA